jgi:hypothetical protein
VPSQNSGNMISSEFNTELHIRESNQKFPDWVPNETTTTTINTRWEATQRVMAPKLNNRLTHKIAIQLHLVAESCIICDPRSRRPVRKHLDISSNTLLTFPRSCMNVLTCLSFYLRMCLKESKTAHGLCQCYLNGMYIDAAVSKYMLLIKYSILIY